MDIFILVGNDIQEEKVLLSLVGIATSLVGSSQKHVLHILHLIVTELKLILSWES